MCSWGIRSLRSNRIGKLNPKPWLLGVTLALSASLAQAGLIETHGGTAGHTPGNNDVLGAGVAGLFGANLWLNGPAQVTYTYVGKEAGWTNRFEAAGGSAFVTGSSRSGDSFSLLQNVAGYLDFSFLTRAGLVDNGSNSVRSVPSFFTQRLSSGSVMIALDDGGAGPDSDFDDLVLRVDATSVPEPATLAVLGAGLLFLGVIRRRGETSTH